MNKWLSAILLLAVLFLVVNVFAGFFLDSNSVSEDSIVVYPLHGVISTSGDGSNIFKDEGISSSKTVKEITELSEDDNIKGIIFEIDSPGGAVVPSQEISEAIKKLEKPNYAVIRSVGASGGYWIASSTDKIFASEMSVTGSIGVLGGYLEFSQLMENYGINYERFVGGKYKDIGSPYKNLSEEEEKIFQSKIDMIHNYFINEVAENRNMEVNQVKKLATGEIYLGIEAKELGLIDEFGDKDTASDAMKKELGDDSLDVVYLEKQVSLLQLLSGFSSYYFGRGVASEVLEFDLKNNYGFDV